jgi:hypothetical protein
MPASDTTICHRTCTLLASISPLTPRQVRIALSYPAAGAILQHLVEMGRVQPVSASARQRQASGGQGSAYALAVR